MKWKKVERSDEKRVAAGVICWQYEDGEWDVDIHLGGTIMRGIPDKTIYWHPLPID